MTTDKTKCWCPHCKKESTCSVRTSNGDECLDSGPQSFYEVLTDCCQAEGYTEEFGYEITIDYLKYYGGTS
jgi:hypothetical protein